MMPTPLRVALAGGNGFIGRHVVAALEAAGHRCRILARSVDPHEDTEIREHRAIDVGAGPLPPDVLEGCDAVVNLVGIKTPRGANDFDRAHVAVVQHLVDAMRAAGIERFVHVSVAQDPDAQGPYAQTKRAGETCALDSDRATTILRPGLVYGEGDEPLRNLIQMVSAAPIVPVPSDATGPLPAIDVRDVALAIVAAIERPETIGQTIDLVGPQVHTLRTLVRQVAHALELPTAVPAVPRALARLGATAMERVFADPLLTTSQLTMLTKGLPGDPDDAPRVLGVQPRPLTADRIRSLATTTPPLLPSVRLMPSAAHRRAIATTASAIPRWPLVAALALAFMLVGPSLLPSVWTRMAVINGALLVAVAALARPALSLLAVRPAHFVTGLVTAVVLYLGADAFMAGLRLGAPELARQVQEVYGWSADAPLALRLGLLPLIVLGEDVVWRGVITLPLVARIGPVAGCLAAGSVFAVAHLTTGPPLLWIAALAMGALWSALAVRTRSLIPVVVSHLTWDLAVMFVAPL